jgi:hypothetical protein
MSSTAGRANHTRLVALFSEPIGDAFTVLLGSLGIETIWQVPGA